MKASLLCLIGGLDLEDHNVEDLVRAYKQFDKEASSSYINLIVRRALTVVLNRGGVKQAKRYLQELKQTITINSEFLTTCAAAFAKEELTEIVLTEQSFRSLFLDHIHDRFVVPLKDNEDETGNEFVTSSYTRQTDRWTNRRTDR